MNEPTKADRVGMWTSPAVIAENHFKYKSLSNWACNVAVGCAHACRFCYVPSASTIRQGPALAKFGVEDPDAEWGEYVLVRPWDDQAFLASLAKAEKTPEDKLAKDGNKAVMFCSTTDPYQVVRHPDRKTQREIQQSLTFGVRRALKSIRDLSNLNVRILTRSPLAREDFDLFKSFGDRLLFGMSLPTLNNTLAKVYEPRAPSPTQRLNTLKAAKEAGLNVYVAMAPTYPECDEADLRKTLTAIGDLDPVTIFHEPINIRAENVRRIQDHATAMGVRLNTEVFQSPAHWQAYAVNSLATVERIAGELNLTRVLHLWPDQALGSQTCRSRVEERAAYGQWLDHWWGKVSAWPGKAVA